MMLQNEVLVLICRQFVSISFVYFVDYVLLSIVNDLSIFLVDWIEEKEEDRCAYTLNQLNWARSLWNWMNKKLNKKNEKSIY